MSNQMELFVGSKFRANYFFDPEELEELFFGFASRILTGPNGCMRAVGVVYVELELLPRDELPLEEFPLEELPLEDLLL